ncbi:MAG TPA: hypothetical protein VM261_36930 [Kofleriaceae bacterium]|nr:hypothetical protein [Kofleriaceae bacterium]
MTTGRGRGTSSRLIALSLAFSLLLPTTLAHADADDDAKKNEARALLQGGNKLRETGDLPGALGLYERAYATYPSAKILLNIGTTLRDLERNADAANVYARYLVAPDVAADRVKEVTKILGELDRTVGQLAITVQPGDAEIAIGDGPYLPASQLARWRAAPGTVTVRARKDGFEPGQIDVKVKKGKTAAVALSLTAIEVDTPVDAGPVDTPPVGTTPDTDVHAVVTPHGDSKLGVTARALIDGRGRGAAGSAGALFRVSDRVEIHGALIFARPGELTVGAYIAAHVELGRGSVRPRIVAGVPVMFDDGPRASGRAAAGLAWFASPSFAVALELGAEYVFNPADDIDAWQLTPTLGAEAHL